MDRISFKNFRKFKDETSFELNMINLLVGPNNSGKSTLTKGLRLYIHNILSLQVNSDNMFYYRPFFDFSGNTLDNPHVGTFRRALSKDADDNNIYFSIRFIDLEIKTVVSRYSKNYKNENGEYIDFYDETSAPISKVIISNIFLDVRFTFDFEDDLLTGEFNVSGDSSYYTRWSNEIAEFKKDIDKEDSTREMKEYIAFRILRLQKCLDFGLKNYARFSAPLSPIFENGERAKGQFYLAIINSILTCSNKELFDKDEGFEKFFLKEDLFAYYFMQIFEELVDDFKNYVNSECVKTIEAHSVTHSLIYNVSDKNDYMAQTISDYKVERIKDDDPEKTFIKTWMKKFNIGEDFIIDSFGGECYKFEIIEDVDNYKERTPLIDKGVGSNQLMILLLRLAIIMHQNRGATIPYTIIIEEPEQNLHPKLQSLLADLFLEVYQYPQKSNKESWGITFIIETHSEYIVRQSQLLVAQQNYTEHELIKNNPFSVYYLPDNGKGLPYTLGYMPTGNFKRPMGTGFYNEAGNKQMELMKISMKKNHV